MVPLLVFVNLFMVESVDPQVTIFKPLALDKWVLSDEELLVEPEAFALMQYFLVKKIEAVDCCKFYQRHNQRVFGWSLETESKTAPNCLANQKYLITKQPVETLSCYAGFLFKLTNKIAYVDKLVVYYAGLEITFKLDHIPFDTVSSYISRIKTPTHKKLEVAVSHYKRFSNMFARRIEQQQYLLGLEEKHFKSDDPVDKVYIDFVQSAIDETPVREDMEVYFQMDEIRKTLERSYGKDYDGMFYFTIVNGEWTGGSHVFKLYNCQQ